MQRLNIGHVTEYLFSGPVTLLPHRLLLRPRESHGVRIESSLLEIFPAHTVQWKRDVLDNSMALVHFHEASDRLRITSNVVIQHYEDNPFDFLLDDYAVFHPFEYGQAGQEAREVREELTALAPFRQAVYPADQAGVQGWLEGLALNRPLETLTKLNRLNREIAGRFYYRMREEPGVQSPALTLALNSGSCRDFAALFMEACRCLGLASRFVSGYLHAPASEANSGTTHAWAEVYLPGAGWKGFDPTSGEVVGNHHIATAVALHPEAIPPVAGSFIGAAGVTPRLLVGVRVNSLEGV